MNREKIIREKFASRNAECKFFTKGSISYQILSYLFFNRGTKEGTKEGINEGINEGIKLL